MRIPFIWFYCSVLFFLGCEEKRALYEGMRISESLTLARDTFLFTGVTDHPPAADISTGADPTLLIEGRDLVIDFNGSVLIGSTDLRAPENFSGIAVHVKDGSNITIKNLKVHGYAVGLFAENVNGLYLEDCSFSYLYRGAPDTQTGKKSFPGKITAPDSDWLHALAAGVGVLLRNCNEASIHKVEIHHAQNGLLLDNCKNGLLYENSMKYNAGVGIGVHQSQNNQILYNRLDWNFNHSKMDKAEGGFLFLGASTNNTLAYNSITHSGSDQLFYGKKESVLGGNLANQIRSNDFSYAPNYGVIKTFESGNDFEGNVLAGCRGEILGDSEDPATSTEILKEVIDEALASTFLPEGELIRSPLMDAFVRQGCENKIMGAYGPYDFSYPHLEFRRTDEEGNFYFTIFGPPGNWELKEGIGFSRISQKRGTLPASIVLTADSAKEQKSFTLEFIGPSFTDEFGVRHKKGKPFSLSWSL